MESKSGPLSKLGSQVMPIRNNCSNLPRGAFGHIRRSLRWINPADLVGIAFIELRDKICDADGEAPEWHRRAAEEGYNVNGLYFGRQGALPANITLFVRDLYRGIPKMYWFTPVITLAVAKTLAHEVGHHLINERGYIFLPGERVRPAEYEEEMAYRYSYSVIKKMKAHWYYRLASWAIRDLAWWHYVHGMLDWREGNYKRAAERWYKSFRLDPDRNEAIYWHKRAKEAAAAEEQSDAKVAFPQRDASSK
jgi:hypothetical protein